MTFEERKRAAKKLVVEFLDDFSPPRGLSVDQQTSRITAVADAFARRMPLKGDFAELCDRVLMKIRDTHLSNSWPPQAAFVMAMPQSEAMFPKAAETFQPNEDEIAAKKMTEGEFVSERYVWGRGAEKLILDRLVTRDALDRYRESSINRHRQIFGKFYQDVLVKRYGHQVLPYFSKALLEQPAE